MEDTSPEQLKLLYRMINGMSLVERAKCFFDLNQTARELTKQGIRIRNPNFTEDEVAEEFRRLSYLSYRSEEKNNSKDG